MKTLYISDLDGTLLTPQVTLSDDSARLLSRLISRGILFTVASARTPYSAVPILKALPLRIPTILMNGVLLYDFEQKRILEAEPVPASAARQVFRILEEAGVTGFCYTYDPEDGTDLKTWYENLGSAYRMAFYQERVDRYRKPFFQIPRFSGLSGHSVVYFSLMEPRETLDPIAEALRQADGVDFAYYQDIYNQDIWYLEIFSCRANKYHAVNKLRERYSSVYGFDRIVGFGDNYNDLPLFDACDCAYAVANAADAVKEKAAAVLGSNTEDAVARFILEKERLKLPPQPEPHTENNRSQ